MTLVAVAANKFTPGCSPDNDWRDPTPRKKRARADLVPTPLETALRASYSTDAHLVTYVVSSPDGAPLERQPRVRKEALDWLLAQHYRVDCDVLFCDLDNPSHAEWTPASLATAERDLALPVLSTCGIYYTTHGRRIVQPLDEPVSVTESERYLSAWLLELQSAGLAVDWRCRDWTRMFRLPNVRRGHHDYRSPVLDLGRMVPRAITPLATPAPIPKGERSLACSTP